MTKTGANIVGLTDVNVDAGLGNIVVLQGILSVEQGTIGLGNPSATVTVSSNAALNVYSLTNALNKAIALENGGKLSHGPLSGSAVGSVNTTVSGPITLSGDNALLENSTTLYSLQVNNSVGGTGGFSKTGPGLVQLNTANSYSGNTIVAAGTLKLDAPATLNQTPLILISNSATFDVSALGGGFILGPAQVLAGNGTILGGVIANGTVSPGTSVGLLTISGNATLAGNAMMELTKSGAVLTNDALNVTGTLACGGTLTVTRSGSALAANDSFRLFTAGVITGSFANYSLPSPGPGLAWDTSTVSSDGWLRVVSNTVPVIGNASIIGGDMVVSGSGGTPGGSYYVVSTTNVALPMVQWLFIATNIFDANGNFAFTNAISPTETQQFFRVQNP